ncbi:protein krueppel-like [Ctenocephalides felis]|uniref:protein krueppel-like n=1 Tax=Ctenocephalides felis TaxID=7515 RepID=UPI000E6E369B|nr:protein krueppel-like [Ctenocephalides felis]
MNSEVTIEEEVKQELVEPAVYECDICDQSFAESDQLKEHMVDHKPSNSKERPLKCEICHKTIKTKRYMKTHMLLHSGERPHKCSICNKTFAQSSYLKTHMQIHKGIRPHQCNVCNKTLRS